MRTLPAPMAHRFSLSEALLWAAGKCGYLMEYGTGKGFMHCEKPVVDPAPLTWVSANNTYCHEHVATLMANGHSFP